MRETLRAAFVIARRDFSATVLSRAFLLFLLAPLFPVVVGAIFGSITGNMAEMKDPVVAVVAPDEDYRALSAARDQLESTFRTARVVNLRQVTRSPQTGALLDTGDVPIIGVLEGGLESPRFTGSVKADGSTVQQLQLLIEQARRLRATPNVDSPSLEVTTTDGSSGSLATARALTARAGQMVLFLLTILLAGMLLSQLIEEKSNKIIEVLAAAVPIDSIFLGKLVAMLTASLLGIAVWTAAGAGTIALLSGSGLGALPDPAVGWPLFLFLSLLYFAMSYLLLGAIFLGIGAHASSAREVQTLSMPVTMAQVIVFAIAALAVGEPDSGRALGAAIFPLSSPYVMLARAAELPELWPHLLAFAWQMLWVAIILKIASRLFRRSVLKSGPSRSSRKRPAPA